MKLLQWASGVEKLTEFINAKPPHPRGQKIVDGPSKSETTSFVLAVAVNELGLIEFLYIQKTTCLSIAHKDQLNNTVDV